VIAFHGGFLLLEIKHFFHKRDKGVVPGFV
jgi:hypothetical protein